jgi:hypothetical protein
MSVTSFPSPHNRQEAPFDRHDWFVRRGEKEVRYVIDFYNVRSQSPDSDPVGVYIDARPGGADKADGIG